MVAALIKRIFDMNTVTNFTSFFIASTQANIDITNQFQNIRCEDFLEKLRKPEVGLKDGSHFIRTTLKTEGNCVLSRKDVNTESMANILILDCDKRIHIETGEEIEGAPSPEKISSILKSYNITHVLYGSYSHYEGTKGNRYRIVIPTNRPYTRKELAPTLEAIITLINTALENELLCDAIENRSWSQGWYYPRKPANSAIEHLYFEFLEGQPLEVTQAYALPEQDKIKKRNHNYKNEQISPINAFNSQHEISSLLQQYKYKLVYSRNDFEKWISPNSSTGRAGITLKNKKVYSHHNDSLNNGYWHDAFDVMRLCEGLSEDDAIKKAAQLTHAPDGRSVDEYNKSNFAKNNEKKTTENENNSPIIKAITLSQFLKLEIPPRRNILEPWLPEAGLCMVVAKRGVGKTLFALEVTMAAAYGASFLKFEAKSPRKVCYIDGEMPANSMKERLAQIENRMPFNENMIEPIFITPDLQESSMPDLSSLAGQEALEPYTSQADLIIVDNISTLSRYGKENEAESWIPLQQWALRQRRLGKSVLFVHHAGKGGNQRGTSKREDILDTVIILKHPSDYEPSMGCVFDLSFDKARHLSGDDAVSLSCKLTDEGWKYELTEDNNYKKTVDLFRGGLKQHEIAEELGLSKGQVSKLIKKAKALGELG